MGRAVSLRKGPLIRPSADLPFEHSSQGLLRGNRSTGAISDPCGAPKGEVMVWHGLASASPLPRGEGSEPPKQRSGGPLPAKNARRATLEGLLAERLARGPSATSGQLIPRNLPSVHLLPNVSDYSVLGRQSGFSRRSFPPMDERAPAASGSGMRRRPGTIRTTMPGVMAMSWPMCSTCWRRGWTPVWRRGCRAGRS